MAEQIVVTKRELEAENATLKAENQELADKHSELAERIARMESLVASGEASAPQPVILHDPFDAEQNPHFVHKQPEGKWLSWKNPNYRDHGGWKGWVPVTYDDEIGQNLKEYIKDPPSKMSGVATQDNYVRRGTDSVLCWLPRELWVARQQKRERKALQRQQIAASTENSVLRPGVSTFGSGAAAEQALPGGFRGRQPAQTVDGHLRSTTLPIQQE